MNYPLVDIDIIFEKTNQNYHYLLADLGIPQSFDLSKRNNKRLYTHTFLKTFMNHLKMTREPSYFFSDTSTKDKVRNTLINKIKRIFAVSVWEAPYDIETFKGKIMNRDCCVIEGLDIFIASRKTPKFKTIKKHLEKEGLIFLNDVYFEDLENKLALYVK